MLQLLGTGYLLDYMNSEISFPTKGVLLSAFSSYFLVVILSTPPSSPEIHDWDTRSHVFMYIWSSYVEII